MNVKLLILFLILYFSTFLKNTTNMFRIFFEMSSPSVGFRGNSGRRS
jgi:hypothetical protein